MKFIATTSDKINDIAFAKSQLIFSRDDRVIYLDSDERTKFETIITLVDEEQRQGIISPVSGYYFVEETCEFWRYDSTNRNWVQITNKPDERLVFSSSKENLPIPGRKGVLYCVADALYQWDAANNDYIKMGTENWEPIE